VAPQSLIELFGAWRRKLNEPVSPGKCRHQSLISTEARCSIHLIASR
jgi:hypothetical protein